MIMVPKDGFSPWLINNVVLTMRNWQFRLGDWAIWTCQLSNVYLENGKIDVDF